MNDLIAAELIHQMRDVNRTLDIIAKKLTILVSDIK